MENTVEIREDIYINGKAFKIISGSIHYFRVVPEYWQDRLEKLKAMGCNTVETYIPWNLHEPKEGEFCFTEGQDVGKFISLAQELGLYVIIRPSPYICAEWEFGGLPAWLLNKPNMRLRCNCKEFLECVARYYQHLFRVLTPLQLPCGGPVILMQLENEYGSFGDDKEYLKNLKDLMLKNGLVVPLVTSDGPNEQCLRDGTLTEILPTANFGSGAVSGFNELAKYTNGRPLMCMEFWIGWFDTWRNEMHIKSDPEANKKELEDILRLGHVNFYMFYGGTNFGFMNGAIYPDHLRPHVTSYDYDAPLTEDGQFTEKYYAFQKVIEKYCAIPQVPFTTTVKKMHYGTFSVNQKVSLFSILEDLSEPAFYPDTKSMEQLGQSYGYILYRSNLKKGKYIEKFRLVDAGDRGIIFADEEKIAVRYDQELEQDCPLTFQADEIQFDILMENMGRVNYGEKLERQRKGITGGVLMDGKFHFGWNHYPLPLDNLERIDFSKEYVNDTPAFYRICFEIRETGDTFMELDGWGKGCVFVNGRNIGRFWEAGPQKRLYIPGPLLLEGRNEIIIFETDGKAGDNILLTDKPKL